MSTRYIPLPNGCANAIAQCLNGHPKPRIYVPKRHRQPLEGERHVHATNGNAHSLSGQSMPQKCTHTPNEPDTLVTVLIESEDPGSAEIPCICLGDASWHVDGTEHTVNGTEHTVNGTNGPGCQTEMSEGQTDASRAQMDAPNTSNGRTICRGLRRHRDDQV